MKKKSQIKFLKKIIIFLLSIGIFVSFYYYNLAPAAEESTRDVACKISIEANARLHLSALDFSSAIRCPAEDITIASSDQRATKHMIAEQMVECWDLYDVVWRKQQQLFSGNGLFCAVCSRIDFKDTKNEVQQFSKYLGETKKPSSSKTYLEYLARYDTKDAVRVLGELKASTYNIEGEAFPTDRNYAVVFVHAKGIDAIEKLGKFLTAENTGGKIGMIAIGIGAAGVGLTVFGIVSNPVGWAVGIVGGLTATAAYFLEPENAPESSSITVFTEFSEERGLQEIGCEFVPVKQS